MASDRLKVEVAYSPAPDQVAVVALELEPGATVRQAIVASKLLEQFPDIDLAVQRVGVWGRPRQLDDPLRDQDRVEIYRPLTVDPKEARRLRVRQHRQRLQGGGTPSGNRTR